MGEPDDYDDDWDNEACWNCGGEGYVYDCFEEYACIDPESGCDLCMRRCDVCRPRKPNPELQAVLGEALAKAQEHPQPHPSPTGRAAGEGEIK